jgi:DNA-binding transcriptional MerR regulator
MHSSKTNHLAGQISEVRRPMVEKTQSVISLRRAYSLFSVQDLARAASLHPRHLEKFVGFGLIEPAVRTRSGPLFPRSSLERLRRIDRLRRDLGINLAGIAAVLDMRDRIEGLQKEVERLRGRLRLVE